MLSPEAHGILVLEEFTIDPAAARKEQHGFRTALASVALTMRRLLALRLFIAVVAIANLPLFLLSSGWEIYVISLTRRGGGPRCSVLAEPARAEDQAAPDAGTAPPPREERQLPQGPRRREVRHRRPGPHERELYLELLAAKRVALHLAMGTVALLDTSDDTAWKVRIVRELPLAA